MVSVLSIKQVKLIRRSYSASDADATRSQFSLELMVAQLLQSNQQLCKRLKNLEDSFDARSTITRKFDNLSFVSQEDDATIRTAALPASNHLSFFEAVRVRFAFEDDLQSSRVYRMADRDGCDHSLASSAIRTQSWSIFSGLSLADISIISVVALPLYPEDIRDHVNYYSFGDVDPPSASEITATWTGQQALVDTKIFPLVGSSTLRMDNRPLLSQDQMVSGALEISGGDYSNDHSPISATSLQVQARQTDPVIDLQLVELGSVANPKTIPVSVDPNTKPKSETIDARSGNDTYDSANIQSHPNRQNGGTFDLNVPVNDLKDDLEPVRSVDWESSVEEEQLEEEQLEEEQLEEEQLEKEDGLYPCKGCGEILEPGRAYKLGKHTYCTLNARLICRDR
jgi:hypothetical protein